VPAASALGLTTDEYNAVEVECTHIGWQLHLGKGAGRMPTAAAVLHDLASVAKTKQRRANQIYDAETIDLPNARAQALIDDGPRGDLECLPGDAWRSTWLVRIPPENPAWPVSRISAVFFQHGVEIAEYRRSTRAGVGSLLCTTKTTLGAIEGVVKGIAALPGAVASPILLAMEPDA
jgi:hypothetical protein